MKRVIEDGVEAVRNQERLQGHIPRANQISVERVPTLLTPKAHPLVRAILISRVPTYRARLRGVVRIHLDGVRLGKRGLVAHKRLKFGKGPLTRSIPRSPRGASTLFPM